MTTGEVLLPDGARIRGRGRSDPLPTDEPVPDWTLFLLGTRPPVVGRPHGWVRWPDFWLPSDRASARAALTDLHRRALDGDRVELVCGGGRGRTGTAIACVAQLAGVAAAEAVSWTRRHYDPSAVETPWQRRYVRHFLD